MVKKLKDRPHLRVFCINRYANYWFASNWRLRTRFFLVFSLWNVKHKSLPWKYSVFQQVLDLLFYFRLLYISFGPTTTNQWVWVCGWMVGGGGRQKEPSRIFVKIELRIKFLEVWQKKNLLLPFSLEKKISSVRNFLWKWEGFMVKKSCKIEFIYQKI